MKFLIPLLFLTACSPFKLPKPAVSPSVLIGDGGSVSVSGDSKTPPKVATNQTASVMPIPEGSKIEFNEKTGLMALTLSKATQIAVNRKETALEGPVAFDPPKQPTVKEQAEATSDFWTVLGLRASVLVGAGAAIFGLVRGWNLVMYGGSSLAVAGLFGLFVHKHPLLLTVIGIGIALAVVGPVLWHTKLKNAEKQQDAG